MKAEELFEIMKDVPREAWPKNIEYTHDGCEWFRKTGYGGLFRGDEAELMFVGSMVSWLMNMRPVLRLRIDAQLVGWAESEADAAAGEWTWFGIGATPVQALAEACKAVPLGN